MKKKVKVRAQVSFNAFLVGEVEMDEDYTQQDLYWELMRIYSLRDQNDLVLTDLEMQDIDYIDDEVGDEEV